jgi:hypothetical protein
MKWGRICSILSKSDKSEPTGKLQARRNVPLLKKMWHGKEGMRRLILPLMVAGLMLTFGCRSSAPPSSSDSNQETAASPDCIEPENPYEEGSGHYSGYEWARNKGSGACDGNSQSFNEGCKEFEQEEADYQECEAKK